MKRERTQVIHDILKILQSKPMKPTHIMYKANLSSQMLKEYLSDLLQKKFIEIIQDGVSKKYQLSSKGYDFLSNYTVVNEFIRVYGLEDNKK